jgi:hypothetical protein
MAGGRKTTCNKTHDDVQIMDDDVMTCLGQHSNRIIHVGRRPCRSVLTFAGGAALIIGLPPS